MRFTWTFIGLLLFSINQTFAQLTSSNLPIVIITTDNQKGIVDEPKVLGSMKIIFRPDGTRNNVSDQNTSTYLNYNGRIGIELRGSTSQLLPKKPYGFTTLMNDNVANNNVSLLGLSKENDWVLNSCAYDDSYIRDYLTYELARASGSYASRGKYCEVIVNGDYVGLYILGEKIKVDGDRINISKMLPTDNLGDDLTGGYVIKSDKNTGGDPTAWNMSSYSGFGTNFLYDTPNPKEISSQQGAYIKKQFLDFQSAITAQNTSLTNGYTSFIDVPSFVEFMLVSELSSNADAYQFSTYYHKERNGKLRAGPIWDLNLTFGNDLTFWGLDRSKPNGWQFDNGDNTGAKFWYDLYNTPIFKCYMTKRWKELNAANQIYSYNAIAERIDKIVPIIKEAVARDKAKWKFTSDHNTSISFIKTWLNLRINWINTQLNNTALCDKPVLANLVISKIHYNPKDDKGQKSNDLEFIEITNNSANTISLAGMYLSELGLGYQFPSYASLEANKSLVIASNTSAYLAYHGKVPFGQFSRNLSNKSQKIALADAFGNIIDFVEYQDTAPWPIAADGTGPHLVLNNLNSDNNLGSNWSASSFVSATSELLSDAKLDIYPNPTSEMLYIESNDKHIVSINIIDVMGRVVVKAYEINHNSANINISHLPAAMYTVKAKMDDGKFANSIVVKQ
jgi:hypothetical protein